MDFEICPCCGKPKRPKGVEHPFPECPVKAIGEQSGELKSGKIESHHSGHGWTSDGSNEGWKRDSHSHYEQTERGYGDSGTAARYFYQSDWAHEIAEQLANADPVFYTAKSSRSERDAGLDGFEESGSIRINAPRLEESEKFSARHNPHPTVKSITLTKYLATLLSPPAAYAPRRILIPFCGVGSEMIGAILSGGWEDITGIEMTAKYIPIAQARIKWWSQWPGWGQTDVDKILAAEEGQLPLFGVGDLDDRTV